MLFTSAKSRLSRRPRQPLSLAIGWLLIALLGFTAANAQERAVRLEMKGALGVANAEYLIGGIEDAAATNAELVIIRMDTPGGLVEPMRDIVQAIVNSPVPVATYVSPGGARADSAGTYILLASHIAAMAPTTHLGAATPVSLGGGDTPSEPAPGNDRPAFDFPDLSDDAEDTAEEPASDDSDAESAAEDEANDGEQESTGETPRRPGTAMERKVLNDAIAYIRGLAELHGRNADWAERAVRDAVTLTATDALAENVIDLIAANETELLEEIDGREVKVNGELQALSTSGITVDVVEPSWRIRFLSTITNPQIALLLVMVGVYGLLLEGYNPGALVPGVVGVVSLLLAAYALQLIPVNYAGLGLIVVGIVLIVAEAFVPSFGALGLGGIAAFIFGAILMFDSGIPGFGISITFVVAVGLAFGAFLLWLVTYLVKLRNRGAVSGRESIVGSTATALDDFTGDGRVWVEGEAWHARSSMPVQKDQPVAVVAMDGLVLVVEPVPVTDAPLVTE